MTKSNHQLITNFEIKSEIYLIESKQGDLFHIQINFLPDEICGWLSLYDGGTAVYIVELDPYDDKTKAVEMILNETLVMIDYKEKTGEY